MMCLLFVDSVRRAGGGALTELHPSRRVDGQRSAGTLSMMGNLFRGLLSPSRDVGVITDERDGDSELWLSSWVETP